MKVSAFGVIILLVLTACSNVEVDDYQGIKPTFNVETFFSGKLKAHGIVKNRQGRMIRHFSADIDAYWEGGVGTLEEVFIFNDGERQERIWTLKKSGDSGSYIATAGDVIGEGTLASSGNAVFLKYVLRVPYKGSTIDVTVDDRMYLVSDDTLINESALYKFGFNVGEVVLTIRRIED